MPVTSRKIRSELPAEVASPVREQIIERMLSRGFDSMDIQRLIVRKTWQIDAWRFFKAPLQE